MRAIHCVEFGSPARLEYVDLPTPTLAPGQARVRVKYCGMGFPDALILAGKYQVKPELPFVPGSEISGTVSEIAPGVSHLRVGTRVVGLNQNFTGGLANEFVCNADWLVALPDGVPSRDAAGLAVNYATAYYALRQRTAVKPGEVALVLGAAGNLGLAFLDLLEAFGVRVLAACGSEAKLALAMTHGAAAGFDYSAEPIREAVKRFTGGRGLDLVIDPIGGPFTEQALRSLRPGGRLIVVGFASGEIPSVPLNLPLLKNCSIVGVLLTTHVRESSSEFRQNLQSLFRLYAAGHLRPEIVEIDGFADLAGAMALLNERQHVGKIVVRMADHG